MRLLFVCMGNICRSPLAEGIFAHLARHRGVSHLFEVDSCGTGDWHAGELSDPRARDIARSRGITLAHRARVLDPRTDFERFHLLLAMDRRNLAHLLRHNAPTGRTRLLRSYEGDLAEADAEVPDPYSGSSRDFELVCDMLHRSCTALLDTLSPPTGPKAPGTPARTT
ncbi:MAG: low molecular weight phosphotyrosine protein phosphatase [Phycisphaeraceae bacterium]|nr:low molecular weight phosphotyrosine protein phosphatase [Phycisphaeraceae bacterium]